MKKTVEFFARFWTPGLVFGEDWTQPIETDDPRAVTWPDRAYAFTLHRQEIVTDDAGARFEGTPTQVGKTYYHPDSKVLTLADVRAHPEFSKPGSCLASNMECNRWSHVVLSRWGNWPQPFDSAKAEILGRDDLTPQAGQRPRNGGGR